MLLVSLKDQRLLADFKFRYHFKFTHLHVQTINYMFRYSKFRHIISSKNHKEREKKKNHKEKKKE